MEIENSGNNFWDIQGCQWCLRLLISVVEGGSLLVLEQTNSCESLCGEFTAVRLMDAIFYATLLLRCQVHNY